MLKIYKYDTEIPEDINDLNQFVEAETQYLKMMYESLLYKGHLPDEVQDRVTTSDLILQEVRFEHPAVIVKIFVPFIVITNLETDELGIIEFDATDISLDSYNLKPSVDDNSSVHENITTIDNGVADVFELAEELGLVERIHSNIDLHSALHAILSSITQFRGITEDELADTLAWLGYTNGTKH